MNLLNKNISQFAIIAFIVLMNGINSFAQVQNDPPMRQVLATTGESSTVTLSSGAVTFDYTVGECFVTTAGTSPLILTQGFQQSEWTEQIVSPVLSLHIYKGITPNGDGHNDTWKIDGIEETSENKVSIFNRWGSLVWEKKNYDNVGIVWDGKNDLGKQLPDATYFYIILIGKNTYQGWVELTR